MSNRDDEADDALFGFDPDEPDTDAMIAAADALGRHDLAEARGTLRTAELYEATAALAFEALSLLDAGRPDEAARRINLFLNPKFATLADCQDAYDEAMRGQGEPCLEAAQ